MYYIYCEVLILISVGEDFSPPYISTEYSYINFLNEINGTVFFWMKLTAINSQKIRLNRHVISRIYRIFGIAYIAHK